jgi:hypothetical protein
MPEVAFVMSEGQPYPLREVAETLQYELDRQAVPSTLHLDGFPEPRPSLVYILLDPRAYVAIEGDQALPADEILRRTIFLCDEAPPTAADEEHIALLRRAGSLFAPEQRSVVEMHDVGLSARLLRPGYSKSLDRFDPAAARSIDVMFLGTHSLRRTKYLNRAAPVLARYNCLLQISDDTPSVGDTTSFLAQGRWPHLARAKVVISLHRDEESRFDWRGALDAIHAGAAFVSEHASGVSPLVPGEHLVTASADALAYVVEELLGDESGLARLRTQAYERLSTWIPYALSVAILRAAIVELVGEPVSAGTWRGRPRPTPVVADAIPVSPQDGDRAFESAQAASIECSPESPAWSARRAPWVTLVLAVREGGERITGTLDSVAKSRLRDFELVAVVGGENGESHQIVGDWISDHPRIAARLVATDVRGIGAAWNVGLDFARGPFVLILSPGQELYPRALEVVTGTLEAMPETVFAYPIQEVTGAPEKFVEVGGDYLLSYLGWDPGRVRQRNDIHAPALIRTDRLRQLGGFTTDPRLDGFEAHDLWCRVAERGWRGQLVPQVLVRRVESGRSTVSS